MEYGRNPTTQNSRKTEYDNSPNNEDPSDMILDENTTIFKPSTMKGNGNNNLAQRWAKKQPTKNEMVESFLELKASMSIMSNNTIAMDNRLQTLERSFSELVSYINQKI